LSVLFVFFKKIKVFTKHRLVKKTPKKRSKTTKSSSPKKPRVVSDEKVPVFKKTKFMTLLIYIFLIEILCFKTIIRCYWC
jgi:hypothetical protein